MVDRVRAGVVIVERAHLAVIERHRAGQHYFALPGGQVEPDETVEEAAMRETLEELGVDIELMGLVAEVRFTRRGTISRQHYHAARIVGGEFGTGTGPEYQPDLDPRKGTFHPTWLALEAAVVATVHPRPLVAEVARRPLEELVRTPLRFEETADDA